MNPDAEPVTFDLAGPLPATGTVVVEASAGTGKTYTLAALACRYVAEQDVPIGDLLVVTFTRAAAAELRDRIRQRLATAARALHHPATVDPGDDQAMAHLLTAGPDELALRRQRLDQAVVDFDTATITTIHGFCAQVLAAQGSTGPFDPGAVLVQDPSDVVDSVCADVIVTAALTAGPSAPVELPDADRLRKLARLRLDNPGVRAVASSGAPSDELTAHLVELVAAQVQRRLLQTGSVTFDDQLTRVGHLLEHDPELRRAVSAQFRVVMIDECQDTDPVQWAALSTAFQGPGSTLILVGDPKQAIYSFRGGDVHNYLKAVEAADDQRTLGVNYRSDTSVVRAMNLLGEGLTLGHDQIQYRRVSTPDHLAHRALQVDGRTVPGLWVRSVTHPDQPRGSKHPHSVSAAEARRAIREDLANQVARLLDLATVTDRDGSSVPLEPDDVAVLVRARSDAAPIQRALLARGVASVIIGAGSVTESLAASHWRWLLEALKRPSDPRLARAAGLSWFFDEAVAELAASAGADESGVGADVLTAIQSRLAEWAEVLRRQGVAAFVARVWRDASIRERVLGRPTGERDLTDLDHLAELLHTASGGRPIGPEALAECFEALDDPDDEAVEDPDAVRRRVDSDTRAVRIMTIHVSKGLEFGVVCCPTLWSISTPDKNTRMYHEPDHGTRVLDVSDTPDDDVKGLAREESDGEHRRLTYVALTRALHATLVWWAPVKDTGRSGLARLLFGPGEEGSPSAAPVDNSTTLEVLRSRVQALGASDVVQVDEVLPDPGVSVAMRDFHADGTTDEPLAVATLGRELDRSAGRWSFTAMVRRAPDEGPPEVTGGDPDDPSLGDAGDADEQVPPPPVLFEGLGAGAAFGSLVHDALEHLDFTDRVEEQLQEHLDVPWSTVPSERVPALVSAISAAVHTPLGAAFDGMRLADLHRLDRLDELDFELPVGSPGRTVPVAEIGSVLTGHLPAADPVRPWAQQLEAGTITADLGGFLTGSVDLVLRLPADGVPGGHRYCVVDYKTNRLGTWGVPDTVANYHPDLLPAAMAAHHYPLQAILYSVAVHRYLRWRLPDYRADLHLGPVGYLFVRGMVGPDTPAPGGRTHGVFAWTPPAAAVAELSDLLHGTGHRPGPDAGPVGRSS